jgi:hypothetical protein
MHRIFFLGLTTCLLLSACADDGGGGEGMTETGDGDSGDGDGDSGDGDGDSGDGDGDTGDGDGDTGDGDGDTGDGDGDTGDGDGDTGDGDGDSGDGDGDSGDGDGDGDPNNCAQAFDTCAELLAAFDAETLAIRSCGSDSECGQALQGTSCGCTRDWVARSDADTTCFYDLIEQAGALQCELPLGSTCDCPEADGFVCDAGICNWNYL